MLRHICVSATQIAVPALLCRRESATVMELVGDAGHSEEHIMQLQETDGELEEGLPLRDRSALLGDPRRI